MCEKEAGNKGQRSMNRGTTEEEGRETERLTRGGQQRAEVQNRGQTNANKKRYIAHRQTQVSMNSKLKRKKLEKNKDG